MDCPHPQHRAAREEAFGYVCHACSRCCHGKIIQVNPYEVARLARHLGLSTTEFRAKWTQDGLGTTLARDRQETCVFLGPQGCTVHPARPLVCRLYPLGRQRMPDGNERWLHVEPHPQSEGQYGKAGSIADFLAAQQAQPYIDAADAYVDWVNEARTRLPAPGTIPPGSVAPEQASDDVEDDDELVDMDKAIACHCAAAGIAEPPDIEARKDLHLAILYEELKQAKGGDDDVEQDGGGDRP